jgi:hypothetical protein
MNTSEQVDKLLPALLAVREDFDPIVKKGVNTFLKSGDGKPAKYVQLDDLLDAIEPGLTKHGLLITQSVGETTTDYASFFEMDAKYGKVIEPAVIGRLTLTTRIWHVASGQWIETTSGGTYTHEKGISIAQAMGKLITYLRRYALTSLLLLSTESDDDAQPQQKPPQAPAPVKVDPNGIAPEVFLAEWEALYPEQAERKARIGQLMNEGGKANWGAAKVDTVWLKNTLDAEKLALAQKREAGLAEQLKSMT